MPLIQKAKRVAFVTFFCDYLGVVCSLLLPPFLPQIVIFLRVKILLIFFTEVLFTQKVLNLGLWAR